MSIDDERFHWQGGATGSFAARGPSGRRYCRASTNISKNASRGSPREPANVLAAAPVNSLQQFRVITQEAGRAADFQVAITTPSGNRVKAHVVLTHEGYLVNFTPTELGEYLLAISFGGEPISNQPYRLTCVHGSDPGKVRASGLGLSHGVVNKPAEFVIDTRGAGQGGLGVTVEGPCEAAINCRDNGDGTCSVAYLPTETGDYGINITFNEQHVPGSPFQAIVISDADLSKIKVSGNGVQPHGTVKERQHGDRFAIGN